jgi:adenylosuccinate lyase
MECWRTETDFHDLLADEPEVRELLPGDALKKLFDVQYYLAHIGTAFERVGLSSGAPPTGESR